MTRNEKIRYLTFRTIGNFLVLFMLFGFLATFGPAAYYEASYQIEKYIGVEYVAYSDTEIEEESGFRQILDARRPEAVNNEVESQNGLLSSILTGEREQVLVPKDPSFSIVIPKIGANQNVIENVDPTNTDEYQEALTRGIAHARGSNYPGQGGTTYVFAHSADVFWNVGRYNADFYLLKELETGDSVTAFFDGSRYNYEVAEKKIVDPDQVEYLTSDRGVGEEIIMQTCWPPGTTWKRLLVFAKPVGDRL